MTLHSNASVFQSWQKKILFAECKQFHLQLKLRILHVYGPVVVEDEVKTVLLKINISSDKVKMLTMTLY